MKLLSLALILVALLAAPAPLSAGDAGKGGGGKKEKEKEKKDAKKTLLVALGKSFKGKDAAAIAGHFRTSGKIQLKLSGVKNGDYRSKQALNVLKDWFKGIAPTECTLKDHKGTHGKFKLKYKKDGKTVEVTLKVFLEKEEKTWRIKGIEES